MDKQIVISIKTILFTLLMILGGYIVYKLGKTLEIILISGLIVISLEHVIKLLMSKTLLNKPVSRSFAVIITYTLVICLCIIVFTIGLPPVITEGQKLVLSLTQLMQNLPNIDGFRFSFSNVVPQISQFSGNVLSFTYEIFSNITALLSILILSIYMSLDWENIKKHFIGFFPTDIQDHIASVLDEVEISVGYWVKGEAFLMFVVGFACFVGLSFLGVSYPLALGLVAGLLEIVPIMGPVISAILASIIAFSDSPVKGGFVLLLFFIVQQTENNVLVPKIMQKVSGFSPLVILLALLIGSNFFGIVGAILSVPVTMVGVIVAKRFLLNSYTGSE